MRQYRSEANNEHTKALNFIQELIRANNQNLNEPKVQYIKQSNIKVGFDKSELITTEDVDAYIEALKQELIRQIKENRRITL